MSSKTYKQLNCVLLSLWRQLWRQCLTPSPTKRVGIRPIDKITPQVWRLEDVLIPFEISATSGGPGSYRQESGGTISGDPKLV